MDNVMSAVISMIIGALIGFMAMSAALGDREEECEKAHNVYDCEMVFVPVSPEE